MPCRVSDKSHNVRICTIIAHPASLPCRACKGTVSTRAFHCGGICTGQSRETHHRSPTSFLHDSVRQLPAFSHTSNRPGSPPEQGAWHPFFLQGIDRVSRPASFDSLSPLVGFLPSFVFLSCILSSFLLLLHSWEMESWIVFKWVRRIALSA